MMWRRGFRKIAVCASAWTLFLAACRGPAPAPSDLSSTPAAKDYEAISLFGDKLASPSADPAALERLAEARKAFEEDPSEDNAVWLGRRAAYAGRYREAIRIYTENLARFPRSYKLLRHRGHRYITLRQFVRAAADLERAAKLGNGRPEEVEPEGAPGPPGSSPSTVQFAIFYHLGLARYLAGDYAGAETACRECLLWCPDDDRLVAASHWLYLTLRRLGKDAEASKVLEPVRSDMRVPENSDYLANLLMFKGIVSPESLLVPEKEPGGIERPTRIATRSYAVGQRSLWSGETVPAMDLFRKVLAAPNWNAFGHIAAEVDLFRLLRVDPPRASVEETLRSWILMWNAYDLTMVDVLFLQGVRPTYFSTEKAGLIKGFPAILEHHRGFGFAAGGKAQDNRMWLEDVGFQAYSAAAVATARWFFDRDVGGDGPAEKGPVTFVLVNDGEGFCIAHAHFADDAAAAAAVKER
jgi:tetratricopeptide (TPR) repeat protein